MQYIKTLLALLGVVAIQVVTIPSAYAGIYHSCCLGAVASTNPGAHSGTTTSIICTQPPYPGSSPVGYCTTVGVIINGVKYCAASDGLNKAAMDSSGQLIADLDTAGC